jgi:multidrug efflux pump subunit AcrA (membrane-fusion protein)
MRPLVWLALGVAQGAGAFAANALLPSRAAQAEHGPQATTPPAPAAAFEVPGKTQPDPGRLATIAPTVLHPVAEVTVVPGTRVKKGQPLIKLDDDEAQADVRAKTAALAEQKASLEKLKAQPRKEEQAEARAALESAQESARETKKIVRRMTPAHEAGAIPDASMYAASLLMRKAAAEERAATAHLQQLLKKPIHLEIAEAEAAATALVPSRGERGALAASWAAARRGFP